MDSDTSNSNSSNSSDQDKEEPNASLQERLGRRLGRYASSMTNFYIPQLKGRVEELDDLPGNQAYVENLYTVGHMAADWKSLRDRVLYDPDLDRPDASNITSDGIYHLKSIAEDLSGQIEDLKESQIQEYKHQRHWRSEPEEDSEESADPETLERVIRSSERRLEEIEEKLSFSRYRRSLVKTMLVQIANFDYIQRWSAFWGGPSSAVNDEGESATDAQVNPGTLDRSQKRTILVGKALRYYREKKDKLPSFDENKGFYEWAVNLDHEELAIIGSSSIENDLRETNCWLRGKPGKEGPHLREIMNNCITYADLHDWDLSEEQKERLEKSALESN